CYPNILSYFHVCFSNASGREWSFYVTLFRIFLYLFYMKRTLLSAARFFILLAFTLSFANSKALASHVYGADLFYTYLSGTTYRITLVVYGDCNLSNPTFG